MKILAVKKDRNRYLVVFDNEKELAITEDILVSNCLLKGKEISDETFVDLKKESFISWGEQLAYSYLDRMLRTEKEVRDYLRNHEIEVEFVDIILDKLRILQLVDDKVYAESYVRTQVRLNEKGPQKIQQYLSKKGVTKEFIEQALHMNFPEDLQEENVKKMADKLAKKYQKLSNKELLQKIRQRLTNKGFSFEMAAVGVESLFLEMNEDAEWESLKRQGQKICRQFSEVTTYQVQQKIKKRLYQKGFSLDKIGEFLETLRLQSDNRF
ncbi:MAG: recombination regulator RecX [Lactobacillales bacterium]|jgi:regulatory protein|nr:recombination regulator RecX [Lactobacillales bacterium]